MVIKHALIESFDYLYIFHHLHIYCHYSTIRLLTHAAHTAEPIVTHEERGQRWLESVPLYSKLPDFTYQNHNLDITLFLYWPKFCSPNFTLVLLLGHTNDNL